MTRDCAFAVRHRMMVEARYYALIASLDWLDWGIRYRASIAGEECLDTAREADAFIRECAEV